MHILHIDILYKHVVIQKFKKKLNKYLFIYPSIYNVKFLNCYIYKYIFFELFSELYIILEDCNCNQRKNKNLF